MENKKKKFLIIGLCATAFALLVHSYLAIKFYNLNFGNSSGQSSCNISAVFNCDATSASSYAQIFNIPLAIWGLSANLVLLLLGLISWTRFAERPERAHNYGFLLSLFIATTSIVMAFISSFKLGTYCLYCMLAYLLSFISLAGFWLSKNTEKLNLIGEFQDTLANDKWIIFYFLAIPGFSYIFNSVAIDNFGYKNFDRVVQESSYSWSSATAYKFDDNLGIKLKPNLTQPKMTVVEFADFLCPHCKHAYPTLHAFAESHSDVQFIFKTFPLDGTCNPDPAMKGAGNGIRCRLALASLCAEKTANLGWKVHHTIFDEQEFYYGISQNSEVDQKICLISGINCDELKKCMDSPESNLLLKNIAQEGITAQIRGTPTVFVNGKQLDAGQTIPVLEKVYSTIK